MTYQLSLQYIKDESRPSAAHFIIYTIVGFTGAIIGNMFFGIIGAIASFVIIFFIILYIDQRLLARKLKISSRLMFACMGLDLPIHIEPIANRSLKSYTKIKQNIKDIYYNENLIEMADKCCTDYLLLLSLIYRNGLYNRYGESLSEFVVTFEDISNVQTFGITELNKLIDLKNEINTMTYKIPR